MFFLKDIDHVINRNNADQAARGINDGGFRQIILPKQKLKIFLIHGHRHLFELRR